MADVRYYLRGPETRIWPTNGKEDKNEKALNELRGTITANWPTFSSLSRRENSRQLRDPGSIPGPGETAICTISSLVFFSFLHITSCAIFSRFLSDCGKAAVAS
jgi:hypothetical protein